MNLRVGSFVSLVEIGRIIRGLGRAEWIFCIRDEFDMSVDEIHRAAVVVAESSVVGAG